MDLPQLANCKSIFKHMVGLEEMMENDKRGRWYAILNMEQCINGVGNCQDNGSMESLWEHVKTELK